MRSLILVSVVCLQLGWSHGEPKGVGAYAYQDTSGNRYGGTYGLDDSQVHQRVGEYAPEYAPHFEQSFQSIDDFFPEYFSNLENLLRDASDRRASFRKARALDPLTTSNHLRPTRFAPFPPLPPLQPLPPLPPLEPLRPLRPLLPFPTLRPLLPLPPLQPLKPFQPLPPLPPLKPLGITERTFETNLENQKLAFTAARKAYDLTSNQAGYIPNFPTRFDNFGGFAGFPGFGFSGPNMNSAFASGVAGPGFTHQIAAIDPQNPKQGNVNVVNRFADTDNPAGFYSVQTSSFSSSSDIGGKKVNHRRAETVVNKDGKVTAYRVEN